MATKTIDCIDCGESVRYGRLSCPACGALLASVAGAHRSPARVLAGPEPVGDDGEPDINAVALAVPEAGVQPAPSAENEPESEPEPEPGSASEAPPDARARGPEPDVERESETEPDPVASQEPGPEPDLEPEPEVVPVPVAAGTSRPPGPITDTREPARWPPVGDQGPILAPRPYRGHAPTAQSIAARQAAAYRPPTLALSTATAGGPAWPTGPAGGAVHGGSTSYGGSPALGASAAAVVAASDETTKVGEDARYLQIADWFVVVGAAMSALGFLLPWSRVVIGAASTGGYFDGWGLASPSHLLVLMGLLAVLGLGIVETPVPAWLRTGVLGIAAGGLLLGLAWPYVAGPLGAAVGVIVIVLGGLALVIGGLVASWATRHAPQDPSV